VLILRQHAVCYQLLNKTDHNVKVFIKIILFCLPQLSFSQQAALESLLADSAMAHASFSLCFLDAADGKSVMEYNSGKSLAPASVLKLITSAVSLELLGPEYSFKTAIGYSGTLNKRSGRLSGNLIIKGGGDPALGSKYFSDYYGDFIAKWTSDIKKAGIKRIDGNVISDDSYYDFQPIPPKWLWEDAGNYYGAGAYGISVFDNTYEIHLRPTLDNSGQVITSVIPDDCRMYLSNWLTTSGTADKGFVFAAPYSTNGWLAGSVPFTGEGNILKASMTDPPLILAKMAESKLIESGIRVTGNHTTYRLQPGLIGENLIKITETKSPPLKNIIEVLNHMSINFYAEHLVKELGKVFRNSGTTASGIEVIYEFLSGMGIDTDGMFIEDGSGLSPVNAITSEQMANLLLIMKKNGKYFSEFYSSLPDPGKEGTLKHYFHDPVFDSGMKVKSGSMTRVRSFAGYITANSGKELLFCIIANDYSGPDQRIVSGIEEIIKEIILYN
jgi:serine-type D-Ala-D-Ala carboxypeptidase/endopeptidase (penicillin-binding protein 4)